MLGLAARRETRNPVVTHDHHWHAQRACSAHGRLAGKTSDRHHDSGSPASQLPSRERRGNHEFGGSKQASPHGARREAALQAVHLEQQARMFGGLEQRGIHRAARCHESDGPRRTAAINELLGDSERGDDMPGGSAAGDDGKYAR